MPSFSGLPSFLRLPWVEDLDEIARVAPDFAVVGAPFDMGVNYRPGARFGPRAIRTANYETHDGLHHLRFRIKPFDYLTGIDVGDAFCPPSGIEESHDGIRAKLSDLLEAAPDCVPMVLGGDHSITYPSAGTVADHHDRNVGIIHFDAHADAAGDSFGALLSHATPMRRLIEGGHVLGKNFVQVGLRGYWPGPENLAWMKEQGMRSHFMSEIEDRGFDAVLKDAIEEALDGPDLIYLSVDVDAMDPAFAPGTGTPEPGGISATEMLRAVRQIATSVPIVGMDVVEVSPPYDPSEITAQVANRIVCEVISSLAAVKRDAET
jgi:agmatinase